MDTAPDTLDSVADTVFAEAERGRFLIMPTRARADALAPQALVSRAVFPKLLIKQVRAIKAAALRHEMADLRRQRLHRPAGRRRGQAPRPAPDPRRPQRRRRIARAGQATRPAGARVRARRSRRRRAGLKDIGLVLHCAGPFSATCAPMLEACLASGAHYLDITGEIDVFAHCHAQDARARKRGIVVMPGAGFDVVPTDCLAALLKRELPTATSLVLAFEAGGGPSPGTAKTGVEGLGKGGRARIDGKLHTGAAGLEDAQFRSRRRDALRDDDPVGRRLHRVRCPPAFPTSRSTWAVPPATGDKPAPHPLARPAAGAGAGAGLAQVAGRAQACAARPMQSAPTAMTAVWGEVRDAAGQRDQARSCARPTATT